MKMWFELAGVEFLDMKMLVGLAFWGDLDLAEAASNRITFAGSQERGRTSGHRFKASTPSCCGAHFVSFLHPERPPLCKDFLSNRPFCRDL